MSIHVRIDGDRATAAGPFPFTFLKIVADLSGRKKWNGSKSVTFDANTANIRKLEETQLEFNFEDVTGTISAAKQLAELPNQNATVARAKTKYVAPHKPWPFQQKCIDVSWERESYALLFEMSLGKTYLLITNIGMLAMAKGLRGALIVAPAGVDEQWITEQIPEHLSKQVKYQATLWNGKSIETAKLDKKKFQFFCVNTDMLRTDKGYLACLAFINWCDGNLMMAIDESHDFKNMRAQRTKAAIELGQMCKFRRISTGTPIGKSVLDAFAQFFFLDPKILGHKYVTSFRNRYCIMGGFQHRQIIGQRRVEEFYSLIAPHSWRATKEEELDLPPKIYAEHVFELGADARKHYTAMKSSLMTELKNGDIVSAKNAATALMRLQQIRCGYLPQEDGTMEVIDNSALDAMIAVTQQIPGQTVIWARFREDIKRILARLEKEYGKGCAAVYYGKSKKKESAQAKADFLAKRITYLVGNPQSGGTGLNLQGWLKLMVYFSNSYHAIKRWQSEDRGHRPGMKGTLTIVDLVARATVDRPILSNLKGKKSISSLTLDQIRKMFSA